MICSKPSVLNAQSNTDANFLFKVWLFTDREGSKEASKSDSLFTAFNAITELNLDKIDYDLFGINYQFCHLRLYDIKR